MIKSTVYICNTLVNIKINLFSTFIVKNLGTTIMLIFVTIIPIILVNCWRLLSTIVK